jgi:multimeric flavodoxin WrbA
MGTLVVLNGSHRRHGVTTRCLQVVAERLARQRGLEIVSIFISNNMHSCVNCYPQPCVEGCRFTYPKEPDNFAEIVAAIRDADCVLIGTPVYLDMPTNKVVALLSRLNCMAEPTKREFFRGKKVFLHANALVSGTKAVIGSMRGACEMLGFDVEGRSSTEYIERWSDRKIRGGMTGTDPICVPE